jgi:hypothetical protein
MDHDHPNHRFARPGEILVIFTQAAVAVEPPQGPLDNPPFRAHRKPLGALGPFDNLQTYGVMHPQRLDPRDQLARIGLIGPDAAEPRKPMAERLQYMLGAIPILHTGRRHYDGEEPPEGVDEEVALAPFDLFMGVKAPEPPFSVVFTDWLSIIPALGWRRFPAATRTSPQSKSCIRCQVPSWRQRQKYW